MAWVQATSPTCSHATSHPDPSGLQGPGLLVVPRINSKHGKAAFGHYAPTSWNKLPKDLRYAPTLLTFKSRLKTLLFSAAFGC